MKNDKPAKISFSTQITDETKAKIDEALKTSGLTLTNFTEAAFHEYIIKLFSEKHPDYAASIAFVQQALEGVTEQFLNAISAAEKANVLADERVRTITEKLSSENNMLRKDVQEQRDRAKEFEHEATNSNREYQIIKATNANLRDRIEILEAEKRNAEKAISDANALKDEIVALKAELARERADKDMVYKQLAEISSKLVSSFGNVHDAKADKPYIQNTDTDNIDIYIKDPALKKRFDRFWDEYPRKQSQDKAIAAFAQINPDDELLEKMIAAIHAWKKTGQWKQEGGKFVPNPGNWLAGRRWEDEIMKGDHRYGKRNGANGASAPTDSGQDPDDTNGCPDTTIRV